MKALSIKQPWAALILSGQKDVENRRWGTNYRGLLLIHAGKMVDLWAAERHEQLQPAARGCILGMVQLVDCTKDIICPDDNNWHEDGYYGWYLEGPVIFEHPIPYRGQLRLFEVPDELLKGCLRWTRSL